MTAGEHQGPDAAEHTFARNSMSPDLEGFESCGKSSMKTSQMSDLFFLGFGHGPRRWCELLNFGDLGGR